ncbi:MAG: M23 family metallopeptidase [Spirochaetia bacterium]|nr:M23 family metallopeptidase [Spirochaetia bacterium]
MLEKSFSYRQIKIVPDMFRAGKKRNKKSHSEYIIRQGVTIMLIPHSQKHTYKIYLNYRSLFFFAAVFVCILFFSIFSYGTNAKIEKEKKNAIDNNLSWQSKLETLISDKNSFENKLKYLQKKGSLFYEKIWTEEDTDNSYEFYNNSEMNEKLKVYTSSLKNAMNFLLTRENTYQKLPLGWPVKEGFITSPFGHRISPFGVSEELHTGYDFAAAPDTPIYATADGIVTFAGGTSSGYGLYVRIQHAYGFSTLYGHCKKILVKPEQKVKRGDLIALVGMSGSATGHHIHYEVRLKNIESLVEYEVMLNPWPFMQSDL